MALITCADCKNQFSSEAKACPSCGRPPPKSSNVVVALVALVGIIVAMKACDSAGDVKTRQASERVVSEANQRKDTEVANCKASLDARKASYASLLDKGQFWDARLALADCPNVLADPTLKAMQAGATRLSYLTTARDKQGKADDRLRAISSLRAEFAPDAVEFDAIATQLQAAADKKAAAEAKRLAEADKARRRKEGVRIGMSADDVRASSWGRPEKINRSTYSWGTHEQWVYSGGYLYFKNGVLDSIQN